MAASETTPAPAAALPVLAPAAGAVLALLWALVVAGALFGIAAAGPAGVAVLWIYLGLRLPHLSVEPWLHLGAACALSAFAIWRGDAAQALAAWQRAAMVAALIAGLGMLRSAATAAPMVQRTGALVAAQPQGRRYLAMSFGAHVVGLILNFGVGNVLGPMVATIGDPRLRLSLATAILRGLSTTFLWSPLTLSFAVVTSGVAGIDLPVLFGVGMATGVVVQLVGWALDRAGQRGSRGGAGPAEAVGDRLAPLRLAAVIATVMLLVVAIHRGLGVSMLIGVIIGAPAIAVPWMAVQVSRAARVPERLGHAVGQEAVQDGHTIALMVAAATMGGLIGGLLPDAAIRIALLEGPLPVAAMPPLLMLVILGCGVLGANPLLSAMLVIGLFPDPAAVGLMPEALALSLMSAWGLTAGFSRAGASVIVMAQAIGTTPIRLGLGHNLGFTLAAVAVVSVVAALLPLLTGFSPP